MGKTATEIVQKFKEISDERRKSINNKDYSQVKPPSKERNTNRDENDQPLCYKIKFDTIGQFSIGEIIPESKYNSVKEHYHIRMKCWDGSAQHSGKRVFYISGLNRNLIRNFLEKRKYRINEQKHHYIILTNDKKFAWMVMRDEILEMKQSFIYVQIIGISGNDLATEKMKL